MLHITQKLEYPNNKCQIFHCSGRVYISCQREIWLQWRASAWHAILAQTRSRAGRSGPSKFHTVPRRVDRRGQSVVRTGVSIPWQKFPSDTTNG